MTIVSVLLQSGYSFLRLNFTYRRDSIPFSKGRIAGDSLRYQALNLSASALLLINCARTGAWPSAIANVFFIIVGVNVLLTVKRARIAQLARRRGAGVRSRLHRSRLHRGRRSRLSAA